MDDVRKLIEILNRKNIGLSIEGTDILVHVHGAPLSPLLRERIKTCKPALMRYLSPDVSSGEYIAVQHQFLKHAHIPVQQSVISYFEKQCSMRPDITAVSFNGHSINYLSLNRKAAQLAGKLLNYGAGRDTVVAVFMDRSIELVVSILAVFKVGAVYMPVDTCCPKERIRFQLEDANVKAIIIQKHLETRLPGTSAWIICLDEENSVHSEQRYATTLSSCRNLTNSACIIYTSGTTGKPKGVEILHRGLTNILLQIIRELVLDENDIFIAIASISFDISLFELLVPLMVGGKIILLDDDDRKDPSSIAKTIQRYNVTVLQATPSMWKLLNRYNWQSENGKIKAISTGEALPEDTARDILRKNPLLWNLYGPTETSIWATGKKFESEKEISKTGSYVSIGRPFPNYKILILDDSLNPVPEGVVGELYIGGAGLAKSYVNRQSTTGETFLRIPFVKSQYNKFYKSGDLVRMLPNNDLEYMGRVDNQLKINGYRIELGEIESVLKQHTSIEDVLVNPVTNDNNNLTFLVAYVIPKHGAYNKTSESFKGYLEKVLPYYMLPQCYMFMEEFPLTVSGKSDRSALPRPDLQNSINPYVKPRDEIEEAVAGIFCDILEIQKISIYENFFDAGGSSMLAAILLMPINDHFQVDLTLKDILEVPPTVSNISSLIRRQGL